MPAPVAPVLGFALGALFARMAVPEFRAKTPAISLIFRMWVLVGLFAGLVFAPITAYFLAYEPDWSYAYMLDSEHASLLPSLSVFFASMASVPLGFSVGTWAVRFERPGVHLTLLLVPLFVAVGFVLMTARRLSVHGTFAQYHGNFGLEPISGSVFGYALIWMLSILCLAIGWTVHALWRLNRDR